MPLLILNSKKFHNFSGTLSIDWNNYFADKLALAMYPHDNGYMYDAITGSKSLNSYSSIQTVTSMPLGECPTCYSKAIKLENTSFIGKSGLYGTWKDTIYEQKIENGLSKFTFLVVMAQNTSSTSPEMVWYGNWSGVNAGSILIDNGYAYTGNILGHITGSPYNFYASPTYLLGNPFKEKLHAMSLSSNGSGQPVSIFYGKRGTSYYGATFGNNIPSVNVNDKTISNLRLAQGYYALALIWADKALTLDEYSEIVNNPHQLFKSDKSKTFIGSNITLLRARNSIGVVGLK